MRSSFRSRQAARKRSLSLVSALLVLVGVLIATVGMVLASQDLVGAWLAVLR
ncbi:hypothetical protein M446_0996 [Methylobacterium sp. 4-46]|nr:hypothetical protein M446_0996 [Methylobacterium sp. 4-46]